MKASPGPLARATFPINFSSGRSKASIPESSHQPGPIPRVTQLLALAHRIDRMIRAGQIRDWAEASRLAGVTRARMTQIANLLLLAPEIQEALLGGHGLPTERQIRPVLRHPDWEWQKRALGPGSLTAPGEVES
jgi:hypothetical protein